MATIEPQARPSFWERMMSVPKQWLYIVLMIVVSLSLLPTVVIPTKPQESVIDLYVSLMSVPDGSTMIVLSDWTNSTRGESAGAMEALLRIIMRKNIKFALMAVADPQAPQVARDTIARINQERRDAGQRPYEKWTDYVEIGYFPNVEGTFNAMANNLRTAFEGKKDAQPGVGATDVFRSPVLQNVQRVEDIPLIVDIHASDVAYRLIERVGGRAPLASMCTGVMGPETLNYYASKQLVGVSVGLNGVVELETIMDRGIDPDGKDGAVKAPGRPAIPGFKGEKNLARGMNYYLALHSALGLIILAVVIGNIGMVASRRRSAQ